MGASELGDRAVPVMMPARVEKGWLGILYVHNEMGYWTESNHTQIHIAGF